MKTYDPGKIVISFAGQLISGFADGTFVMAERNEDTWNEVSGSNGEAVRIRNRNQLGKLTLTLMGSSLSNDILSAIATVDELSGEGVGPLFVKDLNGATVISATNAWIKKPANVEYGKELSNREWVIQCEKLNMFAGGNV